MYRRYFKRLLDINLSLTLILLLFPLMFLIFISVWIFIGFPIFSQKRPGLNNRIFTLYKFKTLYDSTKNILKKQEKQARYFFKKMGLR
jgi:undecaprenyl phosphate N,N'-diacetylbacillosamine 1-phosphate transferase